MHYTKSENSTYILNHVQQSSLQRLLIYNTNDLYKEYY